MTKNTILRFFMISALSSIMLVSAVAERSQEENRPIRSRRPAEGRGSNLSLLLEELPLEALSEEERQGILFMVEEERLAHDIYMSLGKIWDIPVFRNITASEAVHMNSIEAVAARYDISVPSSREPGVYSNQELQKLYSSLLERGQNSLNEALQIGVEIEELDIKDLEEQLKITDNQDLKLVYENLLQGSRNHLAAFSGSGRGNRRVLTDNRQVRPQRRGAQKQ